MQEHRKAPGPKRDAKLGASCCWTTALTTAPPFLWKLFDHHVMRSDEDAPVCTYYGTLAGMLSAHLVCVNVHQTSGRVPREAVGRSQGPLQPPGPACLWHSASGAVLATLPTEPSGGTKPSLYVSRQGWKEARLLVRVQKKGLFFPSAESLSEGA